MKNWSVAILGETQQSYLKELQLDVSKVFNVFESPGESEIRVKLTCVLGAILWVYLFPWPQATYVLSMPLTLNSIAQPRAKIPAASFFGLPLASSTSFIQT